MSNKGQQQQQQHQLVVWYGTVPVPWYQQVPYHTTTIPGTDTGGRTGNNNNNILSRIASFKL